MSDIPEGYYLAENGMLKMKDASEQPTTSPQIDPTDLVAVKAMTWAKLVQIASTMPPNAQGLPVLRELMDRLDGKPAQTVQMNVTDQGLDKVSTDKLLRLAAMLDEPVVIAPMPKSPDIDN